MGLDLKELILRNLQNFNYSHHLPEATKNHFDIICLQNLYLNATKYKILSKIKYNKIKDKE